MTDSIAIIGGGAGGIFAAIAASQAARERKMPLLVHLFERNSRLGIKILISGGGKCNITHAGSIDDLLREGFARATEQRFLRSALYRYSNDDVVALLERHNVRIHARENSRIFPVSGRAEDVLIAFEQELRSQKVLLHTNTRIEGISVGEDDHWNITGNTEFTSADAIILATGGTSYSKTGTTGDGIAYAQSLGHTIVPVRAALAPIYLTDVPTQSLVGISFRSIVISVTRNGKVLARRVGDVLITHRGLSGPAILGISNEAATLMEQGTVSIEANIVAQPEASVREMIISAQTSNPNQQVNTYLESLMPNRFVHCVMVQASVPIERKWHELTREERGRIATTLTHYRFGEVSEVPLERGEVTSGGVALGEVDPKTMMSRIRPGLFFAGEMLDIAGEIGGYNLQAAYSTGWVAGSSAIDFLARRNKKESGEQDMIAHA